MDPKPSACVEPASFTAMSVVVAAADTFRAAAIDQLEQHANNLNVKLVKHDYGADAAAVAFDATVVITPGPAPTATVTVTAHDTTGTVDTTAGTGTGTAAAGRFQRHVPGSGSDHLRW